MQLTTSTATPVQVTVANGQKMISDKTVKDFSSLSQGHTFHTTVRVLPLKCYDLVLGMDWLEYHSPMWVHWKRKIMRFTHEGKRISLFGVKPKTKSCLQLSGKQLQGLLRKGSIAQLLQLSPVQEHIMEAPIPEQIQTLIQVYDPIFQEPKQLPPQRAMDHHIPLIPGATPVNVKPYRYSPSQKDETESQLQEMLRNGIIQPSVSPFASPVLLIKKKDGSWRFCVDYRRVNALTVKNKYPMPIVDELLDELHGACWFTKLDLRFGYHRIRVVPSDIHKTAFKTHDGHLEFCVMPFGLTNTPATFQAVMNHIFAPMLRKSVLVFMDDILVFSKTLEDHEKHLAAVLEVLRTNSFFIKKSKCSFAQPQLEYLGHIIGVNGVATNPAKIRVVHQWSAPTTVKQLRSFLGLACYYRKFIRQYGIISRPLTDLLKKGVQFV
jgi:hypothetical protein